jgi:hypothetical protein
LLRNKASAARPPALKPVPAAVAAAPVESGPATVESLGQQLRQVLPTRRLHSVSLCDREANVLWLSEGALGPDEHVLVVEALEVLATDTSLAIHESATEDGRLALFLPVRTPTADLVGIAMILADSKSISDDTLERMSAAPVRAIILRLAVLLKPSQPRPPSQPREPSELSEAEAAASVELSDMPGAPEVEAALAAVPAAPLMSAEEVDQFLEFEMPDEKPEKPLPPLRDIPVARPAPSVRLPPPTEAADSDMLSLELLDEPPGLPPPALLLRGLHLRGQRRPERLLPQPAVPQSRRSPRRRPLQGRRTRRPYPPRRLLPRTPRPMRTCSSMCCPSASCAPAARRAASRSWRALRAACATRRPRMRWCCSD